MGFKNPAASVIAAGNLASDAITAAKIATDAIGASELAATAVEEIAAGTAVANAVLGTKVTKATADTINTAAVPLFTVAGGRVLLTAIFGEVTTIIQAQATTSRLQFNPTTGTTNNLCADLDINADEVGTLYSITGTPADAMLRSESGAVRNMTPAGIILDAGDIEQISGADSTGSIQWTAYYIPIDSGATLAAA